MNKIANWVDANKLTLNSKKCNYMTISKLRGRSVPGCTLSLNGQSLDKLSKYRYLGVVLTDDLTWSTHIGEITSKARKIIGLIYGQFYSVSSKQYLLQLNTSLVRPHVEYASQVWDPFLIKDIKRLESVQRFALRMCCIIGTLVILKNYNKAHCLN